MTHDQELELQNDLEFLRERFCELNQGIKLPHSLYSDILCDQLEQLPQEGAGKVRAFPWAKGLAGFAACFVCVFAAVWAMMGPGENSAAMPEMAAATAEASQEFSVMDDTVEEEMDEMPLLGVGANGRSAELPADGVGGPPTGGVQDAPAFPGIEEKGTGDHAVACSRGEYTPLASQEQAEQQPLGEYLPQLPQGLAYSSGGIYAEGMLGVFYSGSAGELMVNISQYQEADAENLVDPQQPETYDLRLYTIPYAESIPEPYWQTTQWPIFKLEDFSQEQAQARVLYSEEPGDEKYQGNFGLLLEEQGVVVQLSTTYMSPDVVYSIVRSYQDGEKG